MSTETKEHTTQLTLDVLRQALAGSAAAFRCRRTLQPAGGPGDKVFPPTYAGAVYAVEERRIPRDDGTNEVVPCVLLDSVQSQANRMEEALQEAVDGGLIQIPVVEVRFPDDELLQPVGRITSLQAPHRIADAILRDSLLNGARFPESEEGQRLARVGLHNATALYELCPTALVFGMWDSTGPRGGLGAKFQRALVSEVVGVGAVVGDLLRGVRRDPLEIRASVKVQKETGASWSVAAPGAKKTVSPSAINHSSVPFPKVRDKKTDENNYSGITIRHAEQTVVLSLAALRRLRFPADDGKPEPERDVAARTTLAALAFCAATLAMERGLDLRSRCLLWPDGPTQWELLDVPGKAPARFSLEGKSAVELLTAAVDAANKKGLMWRPSLRLEASPPLVELVRRSQELAVQEAGEEVTTA